MRSEEHKINYQKGLSVYNQIVRASYMPQFLQVIGHCIRQFQEKKNSRRRRNVGTKFRNILDSYSLCCQLVQKGI